MSEFSLSSVLVVAVIALAAFPPIALRLLGDTRVANAEPAEE